MLLYRLQMPHQDEMSRRNTISWPYGAWGFALGAAFLLAGWAGACGKTSQGRGRLADGSVGGAGGSPTDAATGAGGAAGTGGVADAAGAGVACSDDAGLGLAAVARQCAQDSDCTMQIAAKCCGPDLALGIATDQESAYSECFVLPSGACNGLGCAKYVGFQTDTGKITPFLGPAAEPLDSVSVHCVAHLCTTDVLSPTPADAGQSGGTTGTGGATQTGGTTETGGVTSSGGSSAPGGSGGKGGAGGSGGTSSTGGPDASADRPPATMGSPCSSQADCGLSTGMYLMCRAPGESMGCGICRMGPGDCSIDSDCVGDGGSTAGTMICALAPSSACYCNGASFCVVGCRTNANCGSGQVCNPFHTCENTCAAGTCPVNYSCTAGGACQQNSCASDSDCSGFCVKGSCYQTRGSCQPVPA